MLMQLFDAIGCFNDTVSPGVSSDIDVLFDGLFGFIRPFMIQVYDDGRVADLFGLNA